jgi:hypothetical protein
VTKSLLGSFVIGLALTGCRAPTSSARPNLSGKAEAIAWNGWPEAFQLNNGIVSAVIVPSIGRVMSFGFPGEESPFWDQPALYGKSPQPDSGEWLNFGGDKSWPAPQGDWAKNGGRSWPPPATYDSKAVRARIVGGDLLIESDVDPRLGIRFERRISLLPGSPSMRIETTYYKVSGDPVDISIWVVTQLDHPDAMFIPLPAPGLFGEGYNLQGNPLFEHLTVQGGFLKMTRNPHSNHKIGSDASRLVWVGPDSVLRIDTSRIAGMPYPDNGSSVEIYTNGDPLAYVELETLGPVQRLSIGQLLAATNVYTLSRRRFADPLDEARAMR